jgi:hypothetical protein
MPGRGRLALATAPGLPAGAGQRIALSPLGQEGVKGLSQVVTGWVHRGLPDSPPVALS